MKSFFGFSMMELIISIVVLIALSLVAIPAYLDYARRLNYSEIIADVPKFKAGVVECYQDIKTFKGCSGGKHHIPNNILKSNGLIDSLIVVDGTITVIPVAQNGVQSTDTYILTPSVVNRAIVWTTSGGSVKKGFVD